MKNTPLFSTLRSFTLVLNVVTALTLIVNFAHPASAQTETVLYSFCPKGGGCPDGKNPGGLSADSAGNLYGATAYGGTGNGGVAFKLTPLGQESLLYTFSRAPYFGWQPTGQFIMDKQGNLYGTTSMGGTNSLHFQVGDGIAFKLSPDGTETTLYNFGAYSTDGASPSAGLVMDASGNFYGTTELGGNRYGTIFRLTPDGVETILHTFANDDTDGGYPSSSLVMDKNGNLYGTTSSGGSGGSGTVFEITAEGGYQILHSFAGGSDGALPIASLTLDSKGNLYGTTYRANGLCCTNHDQGTVFELTPGSDGSWQETVLYNFIQQGDSCQQPASNIVFDRNGNLYGTTNQGGAWKGGCLFEITPAGKLTILHTFGDGDDAANPYGNIVFSHGNLYGTAGGGAYGEGAVFKFTPKKSGPASD